MKCRDKISEHNNIHLALATSSPCIDEKIVRSDNSAADTDAIYQRLPHLLSETEGILKRTETKQQNKTETANVSSMNHLTEENLNILLKAMKIGFYKDFHRKGLLTDEQLAQLIAMQDKPSDTPSGAA